MKQYPAEQIKASIRNDAIANRRAIPKDDLSKILKSGTTAFAMNYKNGVLVAADTRVVAGYKIVSHDCNKIQLIPPFSVITFAGTLSIIQFTIELFAKNLKMMELAVHSDIFLTSQASLLKTIIREINFNFENEFFFNDFIISGYDIGQNAMLIFHIDPLGGEYKKDFYAIGSGGDDALRTIEDSWHKKLTTSEAIILAVKALKKSGSKDVFSDSPELYKPNMYLITKNGIGAVNYKDIKKSLEKLGRKNE